MTRVDSFGSCAGVRIERAHKTGQRNAQSPSAARRRQQLDILVLSSRSKIRTASALEQTRDGQRRKMLPQICRLFHSKRGIALDNQAIEIFFEQRLDSFRQVSHDLSFQNLNLAENGEGTVLVDRVCI